jgi:hypothetical protein
MITGVILCQNHICMIRYRIYCISRSCYASMLSLQLLNYSKCARPRILHKLFAFLAVPCVTVACQCFSHQTYSTLYRYSLLKYFSVVQNERECEFLNKRRPASNIKAQKHRDVLTNIALLEIDVVSAFVGVATSALFIQHLWFK